MKKSLKKVQGLSGYGKCRHDVYGRIAVETESSSCAELPVKSPVSTSSNTIGIQMYPKGETCLYSGNLVMCNNNEGECLLTPNNAPFSLNQTVLKTL